MKNTILATASELKKRREYDAYMKAEQKKMDAIIKKNMRMGYDGFAVNPKINKKLPKFK